MSITGDKRIEGNRNEADRFTKDSHMSHRERTRSILTIKILLFSASVVPAVVSGAMTRHHEPFTMVSFVLVLTGLFLGQAAGDYFYYYFTDFHTHTKDSHTKIFAGWKPLFVGRMLKPTDTFRAGLVCLGVDGLILMYFVARLGTDIIWFAVMGAVVALVFTPVMLRGFKEPLIFFTFGPLSMFAAYYALTGELALAPVIVSLPLGFLITVVAYLKGAHYEVMEEGNDTVILNIDAGRAAWLFAGAYASLVAGYLAGFLSPIALVALHLTIPSWEMVQSLKRENTINHYLKATVTSLVILVIMGLILSVSFIWKG